ncbi:hypothetical protein K438DRAFT_1842081, partial [Mycena galopus ATCC 62051]
MASYAGAALLGLLVHAYATPFHLTLCGHGRASHAPRIHRRRALPRLSASPLRRARHSASPSYSPASSRAGPSANLCECGYYEVRAPLFGSFVRDRDL